MTISLEELARAIPENQPPASFREENHGMVSAVDGVYAGVEKIWKRWREEYLASAKPNSKDPDDYAKPLITMAEILRRRGMPDIGARVYVRAIELIEAHEAKENVKLHRGAIYANLAISHLEAGRYDVGVSWLHAAAQEDINNRGVKSPQDSYALSDDGIFGQFLKSYILKRFPGDVVTFLDTNLGKAHTETDIRDVYRSFAGGGDIHLISSILEYDSVKDRDDSHSDSVRLVAIRDLATLFEVAWKRIGAAHIDPAVQAKFKHPPTLAALICHMHFADRKDARRKNTALNANRTNDGLLWNAVHSTPILDAVDADIDYCAGDANSVEDVWNRLNASGKLSADLMADAVARRYLLAYKIRNFTSHTFKPEDPGIKKHHEGIRVWLLQAIFFLHFWSKSTGQV